MTSTPGSADHPDDAAAAESWACAAYGKDVAEKMGKRLVCFFPHRPCISATECDTRMTAERQHAFRRIQELATVDPLFADLAEEFPTPDTLLGGPASRGESAS
jgi:hypothetical protein